MHVIVGKIEDKNLKMSKQDKKKEEKSNLDVKKLKSSINPENW